MEEPYFLEEIGDDGVARVTLTRALRVEGTPTVQSRWLSRLESVLGGPESMRSGAAAQWLAWQDALDRPARSMPTRPPSPRPAVAARP